MNVRRKGRVLATAAVAVVAAASALWTFQPAQASSNGVALTPPAGWSSWSFVRSHPTEAVIKAQAQGMHDAGLVSHGFTYINIDDFYYLNPGTTVDQYGRWVVDTTKFPDGMANVGAYIHNLGEKFGMYLTPGIPVAAYNQNTPIQGTSFHARDIVSNTTNHENNYNYGGGAMYFIDYAKNPGAAQAYLNSWADLLASYGVDYLKIDGVGSGDIPDVQGWSTALNQAGRPIHLELSNSLAYANAATWRQYANGWRIDGDIECYCGSNGSSYPLTDWNNINQRFSAVPQWAPYAGPGGWNDLDSVEIGNGSNDGLTADERKAQLTLWAISAAPLLLGSDLTHLDSGDVSLLTDDEVLAVDRAGVAAVPVSQANQQQVWRAQNPDGSYTVALFNLGGSAATVQANWSTVGFSGAATVRDLWSRTDLGSFNGSYSRSVPAHGAVLLHVAPAAGHTASGGTLTSVLSARCADSPNSTTVNGTQLEVWDCNGGANQRVTYTAASKALTLLGKCFDAHNNATAAGTHVEIYDCNGGANQQWNINTNGTITGVQSGLCLDVTGATNPNGAGLELWTCNGGANQQWRPGPGVRS